VGNWFSIKRVNTILYCRKWQETVCFYKQDLSLPVTFSTDWFVEFQFGAGACLSIADEARATISSGRGAGITLTCQVENADEAWLRLRNIGLVSEPVKDHPWGARVFYLFDPEGHRLEIWSPAEVGKPGKQKKTGR
jgi:predicted enzyme related to lactoylglutathione lyase